MIDSQTSDDSSSKSGVRARAERLLLERDPYDERPANLEAAERMLHELRVHEIELQLQNEELHAAHVALETLRKRYFTLYDEAPIGYISLDATGEITNANQLAASILGVGGQSLLRRSLTLFIALEDRDTYYLHRKRVQSEAGPHACEVRIALPNDEVFWVRLESAMGEDAQGGATVERVTLSDVTRRRDLEISAAQTDRMASMGILAAGVAHEINNPLAYVLYNIQELAAQLPLLAKEVASLRNGPPEQSESRRPLLENESAGLVTTAALEDMMESANHALDGATRIADIVKRLGSLSRVVSSESSALDLNRSVENAIGIAKHEIQPRARLILNLRPLPAIMAADGPLTQVFLNLIINAAHSIDPDTAGDNRVVVDTRSQDGQVIAEVSDTGCGISPVNLTRVFEPFYTTKGPERGTGLGLAISRRIVVGFGGQIHVYSKVGAGTRVVVSFPECAPLPSPSPAPHATIVREAARGRVLVVDDEPSIRRIVERMLGETHDVITADSGQSAKKVLSADTNFDVILCDLMMPDVSGIELHRWLGKHQPGLAKKLVFVTGGAFTEQSRIYLANVSNRQIDKPFHPEELFTVVSEIIAEGRSET